MHRRSIFSIVCLVLGFFPTSAYCQQQLDANEFCKTVSDAWQGYLEKLSVVQGKVTRTTYDLLPERKLHAQQTSTLKRSGNSYALVIKWDIERPSSSGDARTKVVYASNVKYPFTLTSKSLEGDWILKQTGKLSPDVKEIADASVEYCLVPQLQFNPISLLNEIKSPRMAIEQVTAVGASGPDAELYRIDFTYHPETLSVDLRSGSFIVDAKHYYMIQSASLVCEGTRPYSRKYTYDYKYDASGRIQQVKIVRILTTVEDKQKWEDVEDCTYTFDAVPETDLTLTAFGLPEPIGVTWPKSTPRYLYWLAGAAVLVALGVAFRWYGRRRAARVAAA